MSLLDMLLERELTPEQREARRARAKARREKRKSEVASSTSEKLKKDDEMSPDAYVDITGSFIAKYWEIYNDKYFDRKLRPLVDSSHLEEREISEHAIVTSIQSRSRSSA